MNQLLGYISQSGTAECEKIAARVTAYFEERPAMHASRNGRAVLCELDDGGTILSSARQGHLRLAFTGVLLRPLPPNRSQIPDKGQADSAAYLLSRFLELGYHFLDGIEGQFALAILDAGQNEVLLATDRGGHRSIFMHRSSTMASFSTNLAAMGAVMESPPLLDRSWEDFLLGYEFLPDGRTPLEGVTRIPKGCVVRLSTADSHPIQANTIAPPLDKSVLIDEKTVVDKLYDTFMDVVSEISRNSDRVAVLLGGFDSALIAAALVRLGKKVETFTFRFPESGFTQAHTDTLQDYLGHDHVWVDITPEIIVNGLDAYEQAFNQPVGQMHYLIQSAHACCLMRGHGHLHCLTGDGCDEVFLGYPTVHARATFFQKIGVLPKWLVGCFLAVLSLRLVEDYLGHVARFLRNLVTISGRSMPVRGHISSRIFDSVSLSRLRKGSNPSQAEDTEESLVRLARGLEHLTPIRLAYLGKSAVGLNKTKVEGCTAASGLTLQSPFQHPRIVALARALPDHLLRPEGQSASNAPGKHVLMRMAEIKNLLPPEIIYQAKASPVRAPVDAWYASDLKQHLLDTINKLPFPVDQTYINGLLRPRLAEKIFRKRIGLGHYASHAASLIVTYARVVHRCPKSG